MSTIRMTPSKQVGSYESLTRLESDLLTLYTPKQAANALSNMTVDDAPSPKKNLSSVFESARSPAKGGLVPDLELRKPAEETATEPEDSYEPILTENKHRFVLFPIKYHEVSVSPASFS